MRLFLRPTFDHIIYICMINFIFRFSISNVKFEHSLITEPSLDDHHQVEVAEQHALVWRRDRVRCWWFVNCSWSLAAQLGTLSHVGDVYLQWSGICFASVLE